MFKKKIFSEDIKNHAILVDASIIDGCKYSNQGVDIVLADGVKEFIYASIRSDSRRMVHDYSMIGGFDFKAVSLGRMLMGFEPDRIYIERKDRLSSNMIFHSYYFDFKSTRAIDPKELIECILFAVQKNCDDVLVFFGASLKIKAVNRKLADLYIKVVTSDSI